jgi:hypothetical protein
VGIEDRTAMSEDYENSDAIPPFIVNSDRSILLADEDIPWLWHDHNQRTYSRSSLLSPLDMVM